ncbi:MAG: class I SAM-dependent methyltransferase [Planctomycetota bacterium]
MLRPIPFESDLDSLSIAPPVSRELAAMRARIQAFQDCWEEHHAAQFVAADYELVFRAMTWIQKTQALIGNRFLEWGCGFATVACLATELGWSSFAVEAHRDLIAQAKRTIQEWPAQVSLHHGNFLPRGTEQLADDPTLPSLSHEGSSAYEAWEMTLDEFAIVYSYPWPGEATFHEDVFAEHAEYGAILLMFVGPNEVQAYRKVRR